MTNATQHGLPWYREPWPWLLMAGPAAVIVAGIITVWLAVATEDGLVVDDYYKRGLAINQTLQRNDAARQAGYRALLSLDPEARRFAIVLTAGSGAALPDQVRLRLVHPTRSGLDQALTLRGSAGRFEGVMAPLPPGRWNLMLENADGNWRVSGRLSVPHDRESLLTAQAQ